MTSRIRIALINGSPKPKHSMSKKILDALESRLAGKAETFHVSTAEGLGNMPPAQAIRDCEAIALAFPLYVDAIPSHLIRVMEEMAGSAGLDIKIHVREHTFTGDAGDEGDCPAKRVYVVVNCGFMEADYTEIAIDMTRVWCVQAGLVFGGAIGFGGGGMAASLKIGHGPGRNLGRALDRMADHILAGETGEIVFTKPVFPRFLYNRIGDLGWKRAARRRGLKKTDLYRTE